MMTEGSNLKVGIIGGTGLDNPDILHHRKEKFVENIYGKPSDALILGDIDGVDVVILSRHARDHSISPSNINYRANLYALKEEGCTHLIVTTACGSLQEEKRVGDLVFLDQFIDRTHRRETTFYDGKPGSLPGIVHMSMADPFCSRTRQLLIESAKELHITHHDRGTAVTIEGPRFSTRAESRWFQSIGGDIVNMTTVPEVCLAAELGISYASIALVTDYDCWREGHDAVTTEMVLTTVKDNAVRATKVILHTLPKLAKCDWTDLYKKRMAEVQSSMMVVKHDARD